MIAGIVALICVVGLSSGDQKQDQREQQIVKKSLAQLKPTQMFEGIKPALMKQTRVPLRLPAVFTNGGKDLLTLIDKSDEHEYSIQLAFDKECQGENWCHYGTIGGSDRPIAFSEDAEPKAIILHHGIKGRFADGKCYSYCNESQLEWEESGHYYVVAVKAERKAVLEAIANSAIDAAHPTAKAK